MEQLKKAKSLLRHCLNCNRDISHRDKRAVYCSKSCRNKFNYKSKLKEDDKANIPTYKNYN